MAAKRKAKTVTGGTHKDRLLVDRILSGDRASFDAFFEGIAPRLYRFVAARLSGDHEETLDVVQSTICIAVEELENYRGDAALFTWICGICRHQIFARYRRKKVTPIQVELVEDSLEIRGVLESLSAGLDDPELELERREVASWVHRALDYLPAHYSSALEWKYSEGLSVREIATRLGVGPKAAESVLSRARAAFREAFQNLAKGTLPPEGSIV
ncbi:MAG: RNA polymerase sigma factor [Thermoanaerobaculia bacterium]